MENINQSDLDKITQYAGQDVDEVKHQELKLIYLKLEYLCNRLEERGYKYSIRKDPRKQAGPGTFKFQEYQWAQIYPPELFSACVNKFAYIIGLSDTLHYHIMGVREYQNLPPSLEANTNSWLDIELNEETYDSLVEKFIEFDRRNRELFVKTGAAFGIQQCKLIFENMQRENLLQVLYLKKQIILQGPPGTGKTRMAKLLAKQIISRNLIPEITQQDLLRLIIKGQDIYTPTDYNTFKVISNDGKTIRVKPNGAAHEYNVSLSDISLCLKNNGLDMPVTSSNKSGIGSYIVGIAKYLNEKLTAENYKIIQFHPSYSYEDFVRGISAKVNEEGKVYYQVENKILAQFAEKAIANPDTNFVLIIDEINRANLPSVLGELIYALEYRYDKNNPDETTVESMYAYNPDGVVSDTSNKLKLPGNLYIIGTMNTADRSVGHIDYAIRRRFAFINVLPKLIPELTVKGRELFLKVAELFCKKFQENQLIQEASEYLAPDFNPMDVMPGHSYFLVLQKESEKLGVSLDDLLKSRLEYEIKPILFEYLKDGILLESAREKILSLNV